MARADGAQTAPFGRDLHHGGRAAISAALPPGGAATASCAAHLVASPAAPHSAPARGDFMPRVAKRRTTNPHPSPCRPIPPTSWSAPNLRHNILSPSQSAPLTFARRAYFLHHCRVPRPLSIPPLYLHMTTAAPYPAPHLDTIRSPCSSLPHAT